MIKLPGSLDKGRRPQFVTVTLRLLYFICICDKPTSVFILCHYMFCRRIVAGGCVDIFSSCYHKFWIASVSLSGSGYPAIPDVGTCAAGSFLASPWRDGALFMIMWTISLTNEFNYNFVLYNWNCVIACQFPVANHSHQSRLQLFQRRRRQMTTTYPDPDPGNAIYSASSTLHPCSHPAQR